MKIPKEGNVSEYNYWKGITQIIVSRITENVEKRLHPEQAVIHPNGSCVDNINKLRIIIELCI